jgi:hypothetical protein
VEQAIGDLAREWDAQAGFVGKLRFGDFDRTALLRLLRVLERIEPNPGECLPSRLVTLLWMMPSVVEWQQPHFSRSQGNTEEIRRAAAVIRGHVERILGTP